MITGFVSLAIFLLQFLFTYHFFNNISVPKRNVPIRIASGVLLYLFCFLQYTFFNNVALNNICIIAANLAFFLLCYNTGFKNASIYSVFTWLSVTLSEIAVSFILPTLGFNLSLEKSLCFAIYKAIIQIIYVTILQITISVLKRFKKTDSSSVPGYFFVYPVVTVISLMIIWNLCEMIELSEFFKAVIILTVILSVVSIVLTYVFYEKDLEKDKKLISLNDEIKTTKLISEYNSIIETQNETLKQLIHDEKNHLEVIANLTDDEKIHTYINSINNDLIVSSFFGNTNNRILDLIIGKYHILCKNLGIDFITNIKTSNLSFIYDTDLTSLVGNILENAYEAAIESNKKQIELSINKVNGFDVLTCINSCDNAPRSKAEELITSKKANGYHGNGMKVIDRITTKYSGNMSWEYDKNKNEFTLNIIF